MRRYDAVRVGRFTGLAALEKLEFPGPVIVDPVERALYFFIPHGTARKWSLPGVRVEAADRMSMPPSDRVAPPGRYWLTSPLNWGAAAAEDLLWALRAVLQDIRWSIA